MTELWRKICVSLRGHWDVALLCGLLAALNLHLLGVPVDSRLLVASPGALGAGRVWTVLTHAFVHVSWYHLFLDAGAVLTLYPLIAARPLRRLCGFGVCAASSLLAAMCFPGVAQYGFCGLSGVAHGLLALWGCRMAMAEERRDRWAGMIALGVVLLKSVVEALSGQVVFSFLHLGNIGIPNTWSHLGGLLGGVLFWAKERVSRAPLTPCQVLPEMRLPGAVSSP